MTPPAHQWQEVELEFTGPTTEQPYLDVDAWVDFTHSSGRRIRRPVFWDGARTFRARFASTEDTGTWRWRVAAQSPQHRLTPTEGEFDAGFKEEHRGEVKHEGRAQESGNLGEGKRVRLFGDGKAERQHEDREG